MSIVRKPFTFRERIAVWEKSNGICAYCGTELQLSYGFSIDHVVPVTRGGAHSMENFVGCCKRCNSSKGNRTVEEWFRRR